MGHSGKTRRFRKIDVPAPLCQQLGIRFPIIQAPIGSATCPELVAAVSEAGGLGMFAMSWRDEAHIRALIPQTRTLTNRPFGVNLVLAWPQMDRLRVCLEEGVRIISFSWGDPLPYYPLVKEAGGIILQTAGSADEAKRFADAGADVIIAQGWEAGGHILGQVATLPLVPRVVDAVSPLPVIAAGGIADGRGVAAVLALGAQAAMLGTRFLATREAAVHDVYKSQLLQARETDTTYGTIFEIGWPEAPHRTLTNSTVRLAKRSGAGTPSNQPQNEVIAHFADGTPVFRYSDIIPLPGMTGDLEALALYAGQSAGLISEVKPAAQVMADLVREMNNASGLPNHGFDGF
jgi:NAD(P)H-dependent flavin oxidoreductase YrpB (nitropropane dioxygenase family)